jgi:thiamine biosynthesis protein ThiS
MQLVINGKEREFPALSSTSKIADLIAALDLKTDRVALEHNGMIVRRDVWRDIEIHSGDKFEIVHFVGGGS